MSKSLLATTISAIILPTLAAAEAPNVLLDHEVITLGKAPMLASKAPARLTVIDEQQIKQNPTLNLSDVLQKDASVYVKQSGGVGQIPQVSLRGTDPEHTLVMRDGARLNNQNELGVLFTGFYDLSDISQVEILKGPASVQYGSDAIGGVINMVSKAPQKTGGFVTGVYGENNTYKAIVGGDFVAKNGVYAQVRGQRMETDGTRIFNDQPENEKASYDQKGFSAKVGYDNKSDIDASLSISQNEGTNIFSYNYINNDSPRIFENRVISAKAQYKINPNLVFSGRYSNIIDKQNVPDYGSEYNTQANEGDINLRSYFTPNQNILAGISYNNAEYETNTIINGKQDVYTLGYYAQHQFNNEKWNTQLGVRVEDNERFGTHTVGQGAVRYHFTPATSVYANIGSAFRAPTLNEMYYIYEDQTWGNTYGNPNLKPEKSISYELGLDQKIGQDTSLNLSIFNTKINNLINYKYFSTNNYTMYDNIEKATFTGTELGLKWAKDAFFASAQYAYVKTKNETSNKEIAYRPKHTGTFTVGYDDGKYGVNASLVARSDAYANTANTVKVPGYATVDFNAFWNINPNVKLFTNVQNVGDVQYKEVYNTYPRTNWYINGGRQANVGVTLTY